MQEFLTVFRPLCRGNVLFVPTDQPLDPGTAIDFTLTLATGDPVLRGSGAVVDPFAHGLATGGYTGMAVEMAQLSADSQRAHDALRGPGEGTLPFGVPAGGEAARDRVKCDVVRDRRLAVPEAIADEPATTERPPAPAPEPQGQLGSIGWSEERGDAEEPTEAEAPPPDPLEGLLGGPPGAAPAQPPAIAVPRRVDPSRTEIVVDRPRTARTALVAAVAAGLGLAGGYLLADGGDEAAVARPSGAAAALPEVASESAPAGGCRASVVTTPPGAAVFVRGELIGATPYDGPVPCGASDVALERPRYQSAELTIEPSAEQPVTVERTLERPRHALRIVSRPKRALVEIDGKPAGRTPLTVRVPGYEPVVVTVKKKGRAPAERTVMPDQPRKTVSLRLR